MARPIWTGTLSFGLLHLPVSIVSGERRVDLHFRMLDGKTKKPIRYERVNAETGAEVPWKDIVKAYEYRKGSYVVLEPEDIKSAAPESHDSIDLETFVAADAIPPPYFEKPYLLLPGKKAEKGYVLLRETLRKTARIGIGRVVIRTREYLCAVMPQGEALALNLLRYHQELVPLDDHAFPDGSLAKYRISKTELDMAARLVESMGGEWSPGGYRDEFRDKLAKVVEKRIKGKGRVRAIEDEPQAPEGAATNVVDFMALLRKSIASDRRSPAKTTPVPRRKVSSATKRTATRAKSGRKLTRA